MKPYKSLFILTELYHIEKFGSVKLMASDEKDIKFLINLLNRIKSKYNFRITTTFVNEIRVVNDEEVVKILGSKFGKDLYMAHFVGGRIKKILLRKKYIERSEKEVERTFIHEYVHAVDYYYKYKISDELKGVYICW